MAFATGGSAVGAIRIRSRPSSWARRMAACVGMTSTDPSGNTARTSRARIASFTFSLIRGRRGGKFLGGSIYSKADGVRTILESYQIFPELNSLQIRQHKLDA